MTVQPCQKAGRESVFCFATAKPMHEAKRQCRAKRGEREWKPVFDQLFRGGASRGWGGWKDGQRRLERPSRAQAKCYHQTAAKQNPPTPCLSAHHNATCES